jgi:hypothetical protein
MLRLGAYGLLALTITANALGSASLAERVFLALPATLFGFLVEARTRLALYQHRAAHGDDRLRVRLWLRHPARTFAAWLWLARESAPAFDQATAERHQLRAARDAVRLALPGRLLAAVQGERHRAGRVVAGERGFRGGSGCGGVACDDTVSVSDKGRPSPLPFPEARGGP